MELKELEQKRDKEVTGFFWLGLQIAVIFAIPAIAAALIGKELALKFSNKNLTTYLLLISFVFSWSIVIFIYRSKARKLKEIEDKIKILKNK
jgi:tryptophan-rich sensory protein